MNIFVNNKCVRRYPRRRRSRSGNDKKKKKNSGTDKELFSTELPTRVVPLPTHCPNDDWVLFSIYFGRRSDFTPRFSYGIFTGFFGSAKPERKVRDVYGETNERRKPKIRSHNPGGSINHRKPVLPITRGGVSSDNTIPHRYIRDLWFSASRRRKVRMLGTYSRTNDLQLSFAFSR